jgi:hypothetical protein
LCFQLFIVLILLSFESFVFNFSLFRSFPHSPNFPFGHSPFSFSFLFLTQKIRREREKKKLIVYGGRPATRPSDQYKRVDPFKVDSNPLISCRIRVGSCQNCQPYFKPHILTTSSTQILRYACVIFYWQYL